MASRRPQIGPPGLTRTQQLRQARSAALVKEYERKQERQAGRSIDPVRTRKRPVVEPRKIDLSRPAMTRAMKARIKHAEKFKQEYERKQEETIPIRRIPRRTPAPTGGDPRPDLVISNITPVYRLGRERIRTRRAPTPPVSPPRIARRAVSPGRRVPEPLPAIPERTKELARSMNAQVVQAEPVGEGPIDSIVIPPRAVSENRTTIVSIPQPAIPEAAVSQVANRSIQVISETLDEQDAAEVATVQGKLEDLQQARRDFVMAVANVGGNAVQLAEEERYIQRVPDIEGEMFRIEYGREHPSVVAAREFAQRSMAGIRRRKEEARREEEFARIARKPLPEELRFDVPLEEEFVYEDDIPWDEDEDTSRLRAKTSMDIPVREESYEYPTFDPEQLERFFDVERYPPSPQRGPPPGREHLHPDLWELEDPWATCGPRCPQPDISDLIRFESP